MLNWGLCLLKKMHLARGEKNEPDRLTLVGIAGDYILKPQAKTYPNLPENEDLTMHLAELAGINVVPHTLARMADGELCYLTKRIDRDSKGEKVAMEDACQLSGRMTEDKYRSSYEQVAKTIKHYSEVGKLDLVNYWEIVLVDRQFRHAPEELLTIHAQGRTLAIDPCLRPAGCQAGDAVGQGGTGLDAQWQEKQHQAD